MHVYKIHCLKIRFSWLISPQRPVRLQLLSAVPHQHRGLKHHTNRHKSFQNHCLPLDFLLFEPKFAEGFIFIILVKCLVNEGGFIYTYKEIKFASSLCNDHCSLMWSKSCASKRDITNRIKFQNKAQTVINNETSFYFTGVNTPPHNSM